MLRLRGLRGGHHHRARTNRPIDWKRFSLSALNAFRILNLEQISIVCERLIFLETHKRRSHDSFTTKEYIRVFVVSCSSVAVVVVVVVVAERCSRLSFTYDVEITFGENCRERIFLKRKEVRCVLCRALFLSLSHKKRWRRLTRRRTKKREKESKVGFTERALITSPPLSCFCKSVSLLPRGVV